MLASITTISLLLVVNTQGAKIVDCSDFVNEQKCIGYIIDLPIPIATRIYGELNKQPNTQIVQRKGPQKLNEHAETSLDAGYWGSIKHYLRKLFEIRRSIGPRWVEIGPGAYKSEIIEYPPDKLKNDLKKLMALKEAMEKRTMKLNP